MRSLVWSLVSVAALALAGCNNGSSTTEGSAPADGSAAKPAAGAIASKVTGTVALRDGAAIQLSPQAKLDVSLNDVTAPGGAPVASKSFAPVTLPQSFELDVTPSQINANEIYVVQADLVDGDRHFKMLLQAPVLTKGAPSQVSIQLAAEQTPQEKELADFDALKAQIGGMKISSGTKLDKDVSYAWQVFRGKGEVQFIRAQTDYGDKGFNSTDIAYRDGKPWVVVQEKKPSKDGKATATLKAGWDKDGTLVVKQNVSGGTTDVLSDAAAADLQKQATQMLSMATGGKNK